MDRVEHNQFLNNAAPMAGLTIERLLMAAPAVGAEGPGPKTSPRYGFISTSEVVTTLADHGFQPVSAQQSRARTQDGRRFAKHLLKFRHPDLKPVDGIVPEVLLTNGHNGNSAFGLMGGAFRFVCSNGLVIGISVGILKVRHNLHAAEGIVEAAHKIAGSMPEVFSTIDAMRGTYLAPEERDEFARRALASRYPKVEDGKFPVTVEQVLGARRVEDEANDVFTVLNRIQENMIRGGLEMAARPSGRRTSTRMIRGIDANLGINQSLWDIAREMVPA